MVVQYTRTVTVRKIHVTIRTDRTDRHLPTSDWLSTALVSALIGQFDGTVRVMPK